MDLSNVTFNKNQKIEAAAKDAATGLKLLTLAFVASIFATVIQIAAENLQNPIINLAVVALYVLAFGSGVYGSYLAANALDWAGYITGAIVLGALVPYLKLILFIVLAVFSIDLIRRAGYKFSFLGPLRKRAVV